MPKYDTDAVHYDSLAHYDDEPLPQRRSNMIKPKLETRKKDASGIATAGLTIKNKMTENAATFPASAASVTELGAKLVLLDAAIEDVAEARLTLSEKIAGRDNLRALVESILGDLAGDVHKVAKGDIEIIHAAGMLASSEPQPKTMTQVQNLKIKASEQDAELLAACEPVLGANYYRFQISTGATPGNWADHLIVTKAKCKLNHSLVSGTKVYVRVCAGNANGEGPWSDIGWKTVP